MSGEISNLQINLNDGGVRQEHWERIATEQGFPNKSQWAAEVIEKAMRRALTKEQRKELPRRNKMGRPVEKKPRGRRK